MEYFAENNVGFSVRISPFSFHHSPPTFFKNQKRKKKSNMQDQKISQTYHSRDFSFWNFIRL